MIKHVMVWLVGAILAMFLAPAFVDPSEYQERIKAEMHLIESSMGENAASHIFNMTEQVYSSLFETTGFRGWFAKNYQINKNDTHLAGAEGGSSVGGLARMASNYGVSLFLGLYEITFRMVNLSMWLIYSLPFIVAAAWDGIMQRKAKISSFLYTSPSIYNMSWHVLILLTFCTFAYFNTPLPVPPIIFPILIGAYAFFIRNLFSNIQRSA